MSSFPGQVRGRRMKRSVWNPVWRKRGMGEKERDRGKESREEEENLQGACGGWKTSKKSLL